MFRYDKDMERVMQAKKFEILKELEDCKLRILKELSGVDKVTLTRLRELLADYNNIEYQITTRITNIETKVNSNLITIEEGLTEINDIKEEFTTAFTDVEDMKKSVEEFNTKLSTMERDVTLVNTGMGSLNEAINKNNFDIEQLSNTVDKMKIKKVSYTCNFTPEKNTNTRKLVNTYSNYDTNNENYEVSEWLFKVRITDFKEKTGYNIDKILSIINVTCTHNSGGSGFNHIFHSVRCLSNEVEVCMHVKNNGNLSDIPTAFTIEFLVIDNKDNI